jgi:hypothetical protein
MNWHNMPGFKKTDIKKYVSVLLCTAMLCVISTEVRAWQQNTVESYLANAKASDEKPNHLINESSPYLLQHAYNLVNWYPWGKTAFEKARRENKPIFLSIGYSTCHWCHVMEHESFENKEIADILNQYFVCIKVDREERPDIDSVYMAATELINGVGGWPMTVFLNLKLQPFHAQTYIPAETRGNQRGLKELLPQIHQLWVTQRAHVDAVALQITDRIKADAETRSTTARLDKNIAARAFSEISASFDKRDGGFGDAPKFPRPGIFDFFLTLASQKGPMAESAKQMMQKTLTAMAQGGIFDQVGGGFHRYSVDSQWQVPHFEKMLYSQALLTIAYLDLYKIDPQPLYKNVAQETLNFVLREMTSPQGGFYSALDADSVRPGKKAEHGEGAYYLWSDPELATVLSTEELKFAHAYYNVQKDGNIYSDPQDEFTGLNILHVSEEFASKALTLRQSKLLVSIKHKLLSARNQRPRPHLDDKIVTAWNGMMISAFAQAGVVFKDKTYLNVATKAAEFVRDHLIDKKTGSLYRRIRGDRAGVDAGLADYVWTVRGLLDLYAAGRDRQWLELAIALSDKQKAQLLDQVSGGYFDASDKDASLLFRFRPIYDDSLPAENAIALANLDDLYRLSQNRQWQKDADGLIAAFAGDINTNPSAAAMALSVLSRRH